MIRRSFIIAGAMGALSIVFSPSALACACAEITSFEDSMKRARTVLGGRVSSQVFRDPEHLYPAVDDAVAVELTVLRVIKGKDVRRTVRVWSPFAGSSCDDQGFRALAPGTLVAFAVAKASAWDRETWFDFGLSPAKDDYMVGTCGTHWKVLSSEQELRGLAVWDRLPT